jgi:hypothetical protein
VKTDRSLPRGRAPLFVGASALCAAALLSGCMSSPTYGTGKTANQQLFEDLTGVISTDALTGRSRESEIAYKPRPELVRPASLEVLPEPQRELVSADNSAWPEAPEARRARLRAEATANRDEPGYRSPIVSDVSSEPQTIRGHDFGNGVAHVDQVNTREQRAELLRRKREANQGSPTTRKYLSEPPLEYRVPNATASADELGEDEWKKQQRGKKAAGKGTTWRDFLPW